MYSKELFHGRTAAFVCAVLTFASLAVNPLAGNRDVWSQGHGDLQIHYAENQWQWQLRADSPPEEVIIALSHEAKNTIPEDPDFAFLGDAGNPIWIIPQVARDGVVFMGMNSSDTSPGTFVGNRFDMLLSSVVGPGDFVMWITGDAGRVEVPMNSRDGIGDTDRVGVPAPGHFHQNWGFTAPGTYLVGFKGHGTLAENSELITSEEQIYRFAVNVIDRGEVDIEVGYAEGEWEMAVLDEINEREFEAAEVALHAGPATWQTVPRNSAFAFLGAPGDSIYRLPQDEQENVLFLGIAGDEIETGIFQNDEVHLQLTSVEGPGSVFLYETDAFGLPEVFFDSSNGLSDADRFPLAVGGHKHQNWAFTDPGIYRVGMTARGQLSANAQASSSDEAIFLFEVFGPTVFDVGELDIEVAFEDGEWNLVALDEASERAIFPDELVIRGGVGALFTVPQNPAFGFLGRPGAIVHVLPQEEKEGVIFLGIAGDEIEPGLFENETVDLRLVGVDGPGTVALYEVDAFGNPKVFFDSGDGIGENDVFSLAVGGHLHRAWGFSAPGVYAVQLQVAGLPVGSNEQLLSGVETLRFELVGGDLKIDIGVRAEGALVLRWPSKNGKQYQVQVKLGSADAEWGDQSGPLRGNGSVLEQSLEAPLETAAFFRVIEFSQ
ncbi:MAG: hypothetical protein M2R45_01999 [Verrucomicrobia subdivision 3 bacterium]|nr:hypothetical protein [Limisphaerales bacterium]MCS1414817.1 hypothetical protein [Limisphaerales bacterium]